MDPLHSDQPPDPPSAPERPDASEPAVFDARARQEDIDRLFQRPAAPEPDAAANRPAEAGRPGAPGLGAFDARAMQEDLDRLFRKPAAPEPVASPEPETAAPPPRKRRKLAQRTFTVAFGLAAAFAFGFSPVRPVFSTGSLDAVVNARVIAMRSPVEGVVQAAGGGALRIVDRSAARGRLDELMWRKSSLRAEAAAVAQDLDMTREALKTAEDRAAHFSLGAIDMIDARAGKNSADLRAADARFAAASAAKAQDQTSRLRPVAKRVALSHDDFELAAAAADKATAETHATEAMIARFALSQGRYLGETSADLPVSRLRAEDLTLRAGGLEARAEALRAQLADLDAGIADEEARYRARAEATIAPPPNGRVWETLVSPGEFVARDQDVMRAIDCSQPIVSASVDETVYNRLQLGGSAYFRASGAGDKILSGHIVNLTGAAPAPGNFAITPLALRKRAYFITVALDAPADLGCAVGRTGTVTFEPTDSDLGPYLSGIAAELPTLRFSSF